MRDILTKGREYEAIKASEASLKTMSMCATASATNIDTIKKAHTCGSCGLSHAPRVCPAFSATCDGCGSMGHWVKMCRETRRGTQNPDEYQHTLYQKGLKEQERKKTPRLR